MRGRFATTFAVLCLLPALALADEYTVTSFDGGYAVPPPGATELIGGARDDLTREVALPFDFPFFGRLFDRISVCSNGWLAFGSVTSTTSTNPALPDAAAPDGVVAPLWDDLTTGSGSVVTFTTGNAPDRTFVVSWEGVDTFSATEQNDMSFQVRLAEADGTIEISYATDGTWDGLSFTAGIEDPTGTIAFGGPNLVNTNSGQPLLDQRFTPLASELSGVVERDRPVADATGLGNSVETGLPVAGADVVVRLTQGGLIAARARTDDAGAWTATVFGAESPTTLEVELNAAGTAARVTQADGTVHTHLVASAVAPAATVDLGTLTLDASIDAANPSFREALNIQQAAERGRSYAVDAANFAAGSANPPRSPETFAQLEIRFVDGTGTSGYDPQTQSGAPLATISDSIVNPDAYDDDVVLREYGQHVLATISTHPGALADPSWSESRPFGFVYGFAHWFAAVVQGRAEFIDTTGSSAALTFDLEAPDPAASGENVAGAVAASLWELVDPANEPEDEFSGGVGAPPSEAVEVLATLDIDLDTELDLRTQAFFDVWRAAAPDVDRQQTARAFIHHGTLLDDVFEPNDRQAEHADPGAGVSKLEGLRISPFNEDHFQVVLGSTAVLRVTLQQTAESDLDLEILDAGGARVGFATNVGRTEGRDVVSAVTATEVAAGTYTARVAWRAGESAQYTLSFFEPFDLLTTALPEWTAGIAFKEDLFATGGVQPYAFTTVTDAPGLAVEQSGTRVAGSPTVAGDYTVDVTVADSAAPANQVQLDVPLRINPALNLLGLIGIPEQRDVDVAIGTGGTASTWTPSGSPPGALSLGGGATLRLSGTTSIPQTFTVGGSAVDSVGAALNGTSARIVVTGDLVERGTSTVPPGDPFGFFFDGLGGSRATLVFRFRGAGGRPFFDRILDETGAVVADAEHPGLRVFARRIRLRGLELPAAGRYHVLFTPDPSNSFVGDVVLRANVRPTARSRGQVAILEEDDVVDVPFEALAGSVITVSVQRSPSPTNLKPRVFEIVDPDGVALTLPAQRIRGRGARSRLPRTLLPKDGTYRLRLSGDSSTTGPLFYRYRIVTPRGARFDAD